MNTNVLQPTVDLSTAATRTAKYIFGLMYHGWAYFPKDGEQKKKDFLKGFVKTLLSPEVSSIGQPAAWREGSEEAKRSIAEYKGDGRIPHEIEVERVRSQKEINEQVELLGRFLCMTPEKCISSAIGASLRAFVSPRGWSDQDNENYENPELASEISDASNGFAEEKANVYWSIFGDTATWLSTFNTAVTPAIAVAHHMGIGISPYEPTTVDHYERLMGTENWEPDWEFFDSYSHSMV